MRHLQAASAILLSVPLIGSAANHAFGWVRPPMNDGWREELLDRLAEHGLVGSASKLREFAQMR